jgi:nucleotide-binding universal stress UspA family protein
MSAQGRASASSMFRTIITGYDGSEEGRDALALAGFLAGESAERVVAATVSETGTRIRLPGHADREDMLAEAASKVAVRASDDALVDPAALEPKGVCASSAAAGLHRLAETIGADLVVTGSSHRGEVGRMLIGSTAARLLNGASCAVAAAPRGFARREHRIVRTVGLAYDGSHESRVALEGAARLAAGHDAVVRVFTVVPPNVQQEARELAHAHHSAVLDDALNALPSEVRPEGRLLGGDVEEQLLEQADASLDVMVVGSRGYGPVRRVLLGSTSNALMRAARCPVIVYPRGVDPNGDGLAGADSA